MKRRLKGYGRYFPGSFYGFLILMIVFVVLVLIGGEKLLFLTANAGVIGVIVLIAAALGTMKIGELIYEATARLFMKRSNDREKAEKKAKLLEIIIALVFCAICMTAPLIMSYILRQYNESTRSDSCYSDTADCWDP